MSTLLYFAYGSNMSTPRLVERVSSARPVSVARLHHHRLRFHKKSVDGSAKCDIELTNDPAHVVHGVVYQLLSTEKALLDEKEGLGRGYEEKRVSVIADNGETFDAVTYFAINIDASLRPYRWYLEHVLRGAREHALPVDYIHAIEAVDAMPDPDHNRHIKELSIYRERV